MKIQFVKLKLKKKKKDGKGCFLSFFSFSGFSVLNGCEMVETPS